MRRSAWFVCIWLFTFGARADDSQARELFSAGVQAILAKDWSEAARLLEASLSYKDKPACRFNLIVANHELNRPLEVARHAIAFLTTVEGRSHSEEAAEARSFLEQALGDLVTLQVQGLPLGAQLKVDDARPRVTDGARIYELPGLHRLELWLGERQLESIEIELSAGTLQPWPRVRPVRDPAQSEGGAEQAAQANAKQPASAAEKQAETARQPANESSLLLSAPTRKKLALALGITGMGVGLTAVVSYAFAVRRANELEGWQTDRVGYTDAADQYQRITAAVMPLALVSGVLMASGSALVAHKPRAALVVSLSALALGLAATGCGVALMAKTPRTLVEDTEITHPSREGGSLLLGAALPLLTYGSRVQWLLWR